jgi:hypothetical protein
MTRIVQSDHLLSLPFFNQPVEDERKSSTSLYSITIALCTAEDLSARETAAASSHRPTWLKISNIPSPAIPEALSSSSAICDGS